MNSPIIYFHSNPNQFLAQSQAKSLEVTKFSKQKS